MKQLKFGIAQHANCLEWKTNFIQAIKSIDIFLKEKVDIICFQESYLSGYHPEVLTYDFSEITYYLEKLKECAYQKDICLMMPTLFNTGTKRYSLVHVFNSDKGDEIIYKFGLTPSEKLVLHSKKSNRIVSVNGVQVGVLICREMEDPAYMYFHKKRLPDLIFWPSYWGWEYKSKWGPIKYIDGEKDKCYELISELKRPLIQANMCTTFGKKEGEVAKYGKSVFVSSSNTKQAVAAYGKPDHVILNYENGILNNIKSLG